jgi:hypothetical protein
MARIIQIPVSFEFGTTKVEWAETQARITGWWKREDGTADSENLIAEITIAGTTKFLELPLVELTSEQIDQCLGAWSESHSDEDLRRVCWAFEPHLLVPSQGSNDYPFTSSEGVARLTAAGLLGNSRPADAWRMRDDFLRLGNDATSAIAFLNKWGCWDYKKYLRLHELVGLQRGVREALISPPEKWFTGPFSFLSVWQRSPTYPYFALKTDMCESAIRMTVTVDLLQRVKFAICARRDCAALFAISSNHKRKYCSQYCGHLESVRRNRKPLPLKGS